MCYVRSRQKMIWIVLGKGEATRNVKKEGKRLVPEKAKELLWRINC